MRASDASMPAATPASMLPSAQTQAKTMTATREASTGGNQNATAAGKVPSAEESKRSISAMGCPAAKPKPSAPATQW